MARKRNQSGFTLLEVIVTLLFAAALGSALIQIFGSNLSGSAQAVAGIHAEAQLRSTMEQITRDYRLWLRDSPGDALDAFRPIAAAYADAATAFIQVDGGNDDHIQILQVTVSDGTRTLKALFTK